MSQGLPENVERIPNEVVKELLHAVRNLQNGDISRIMNKMGLLYRMNFGVSIPQLRQLANKYEPNNKVSWLLWQQDIREAKILSAMLNEYKKLSVERALEIGKSINNQELIEQYSRNIFSKLSFLFDLVETWVQGDNWNKILCFYSIGWKFKNHLEIDGECLEWVVHNLPSEACNEDLLVQQAIGFSMQSIAAYSDDLKAKMTHMAEILMKSEKKSARRIGEDFMWLNAI